MIPVRVPADTRPPESGGPKMMRPDHPMANHLCPVCDLPFSGHLVQLVVVGAERSMQRPAAHITAAAVAVHVHCTLGHS